MGVAGPLAGHDILIVEDDYFLAADLERNLKDAGADVIGPFSRIEDASQAWRLKAISVSLAVLDINVAGAMVYPLAEELRKAGIPIIFATGYDAHAIPPYFAAVPRLLKPVALELLLDAIVRSVRH